MAFLLMENRISPIILFNKNHKSSETNGAQLNYFSICLSGKKKSNDYTIQLNGDSWRA